MLYPQYCKLAHIGMSLCELHKLLCEAAESPREPKTVGREVGYPDPVRSPKKAGSGAVWLTPWAG